MHAFHTKSSAMPFQFFDPDAEYDVVEHDLPHWRQAGATCYITFRTADSLPHEVLVRWLAERDAWLQRQGIDPRAPDASRQVEQLPERMRMEFRDIISDEWERQLDACFGACVLSQPNLAEIVANSLRHFDGDRYELGDFIVMPNHVHLLVAFPNRELLLRQCRSWKKFTATEINKCLGRKGEFWQDESFDHLVRSPEAFDYYRRYIADNPRRANLKTGEYIHYQYDS